MIVDRSQCDNEDFYHSNDLEYREVPSGEVNICGSGSLCTNREERRDPILHSCFEAPGDNLSRIPIARSAPMLSTSITPCEFCDDS
ncbi:hypothetical protein TNCV_3466751 [Trichonephila clavipes]|nr:hypothetical protein TNCV_3466751 [Trichonephila clavipes]